MKIKKLNLSGPCIIEPKVFYDDRGFFFESWNKDEYLKKKLNIKVVQENFAHSKKNVLRGLHIQYPKLQGKLISVMNGRVFDVVVDVRKNSPTFGKWCSAILDSKKKKSLWVPEGFGHGYLVLSKFADVMYKCTCKYYPKNQVEIIWNDPFINIKWPTKKPILSQKDSLGYELKKMKNLPRWKK